MVPHETALSRYRQDLQEAADADKHAHMVLVGGVVLHLLLCAVAFVGPATADPEGVTSSQMKRCLVHLDLAGVVLDAAVGYLVVSCGANAAPGALLVASGLARVVRTARREQRTRS